MHENSRKIVKVVKIFYTGAKVFINFECYFSYYSIVCYSFCFRLDPLKINYYLYKII